MGFLLLFADLFKLKSDNYFQMHMSMWVSVPIFVVCVLKGSENYLAEEC